MGKLREIVHLVKELRRHMITLGNYKSDEHHRIEKLDISPQLRRKIGPT
jgi:hypothetical protein